MDNKINITLQGKDNPYVLIDIEDRNGKMQKMHVHGYLLGLEAAFQVKKKFELHNLVILTGDVGSGKSTLIEGMAGINAKHSNKKLNFDNVSWATETFIEKTDREDNIGDPEWWDESIQGASGRNMAITNLGNKLKMAFVTKRFKKHTYYLAIDEINEYAWKLIKMADAWIHVKRIGLNRGYFNAYVHKSKIKFIYNAFKYYNKSWNSRDVTQITPDCKGKFDNYNGLFLDPKEYNRLKIEETKQLEKDGNVNWRVEKVLAFHLWSKGGVRQNKMAEECKTTPGTMSKWIKEFETIVS